MNGNSVVAVAMLGLFGALGWKIADQIDSRNIDNLITMLGIGLIVFGLVTSVVLGFVIISRVQARNDEDLGYRVRRRGTPQLTGAFDAQSPTWNSTPPMLTAQRDEQGSFAIRQQVNENVDSWQ